MLQIHLGLPLLAFLMSATLNIVALPARPNYMCTVCTHNFPFQKLILLSLSLSCYYHNILKHDSLLPILSIVVHW